MPPPTTIRLPEPAAPPPAVRLPVVAAIAPVVVSVALFAATGAPMSLLFAILGPVTAVAGLLDGVVGARRHRRRHARRLASQTAAVRERLRVAHDEERAAAWRALPDGRRLAAVDPRSAVRWRGPVAVPSITVGAGVVASAIVVEGHGGADAAAAPDPLVEAVARLEDAPVPCDGDGIGVAGPLPVARAIARGYAIQAIARAGLGAGGAPGGGGAVAGSPRPRIAADGPAWASALGVGAHVVRAERAAGVDSVLLIEADGRELVRIEVAAEPIAMAPRCPAIVDVRGDAASVSAHHGAVPMPLRPGAVDAVVFAAWCRRVLALAAELAAAGSTAAEPPGRVAIGELLPARPSGPVAAVIGADAAGAVVIDLLRHGPHAVVGGTTGSGKSELLVSWVTAMAAGASPQELAVLLIDFKGGAGFAPVARLPHVTGIVTDLDAAGAVRAVGSLRAEIRRRERMIAEAGLRELAPSLGVPRLVIVVDEYAALVDAHPELHALFADLAARGRSLGVHLIVCTQRPGASVRDAVLANADARVCLRVRERADGIALVGTARPAELPAHRGRAVASIGGERPVELQVAIADAATIAAVAGRWADVPRPPRPWRDPLPARLDRAALDALLREQGLQHPGEAARARGGPDEARGDHHDGRRDGGDSAVIGAIDLPDEQAIAAWRHRPERDGVVLVVGAPGSGRSGVLAAIAASGPTIRVSDEPCAAWDVLDELAAASGQHGGATVLLDDLDLLVHRFGVDHRREVLDRVAALCRRRRELGLGVVVTTATIDDAVRSIEPFVQSRVLLRLHSSQEQVIAGGAAADWLGDAPPGAGTVGGRRVQVLDVARPPSVSCEPRWRALPSGPIAVVAADPAAVEAALIAAGRRSVPLDTLLAAPAHGRGGSSPRAAATEADVVAVADVTTWQQHWGAAAALSGRASIVAVGLEPAALRAALNERRTPPPLPAGGELGWLIGADAIVRTRLPGVHPHPNSTGIRTVRPDSLLIS